MQGDCSASTTLPVVGSGAPLAEQQSRSQCYILSPGDLFRLDEEDQQLVIDNVFLRIDRSPPDGGPVVTDGVPTLIDVRAPNTKLWLTTATLQSDFGAGRALDIADASGSVYVEDALVRDFDTRGTPAVTTAGALHVVNTQFELMAAAQEEAAGGAPVVYAARTAVVALEGVLFSGGSGPTLGQAANVPTVRCLSPLECVEQGVDWAGLQCFCAACECAAAACCAVCHMHVCAMHVRLSSTRLRAALCVVCMSACQTSPLLHTRLPQSPLTLKHAANACTRPLTRAQCLVPVTTRRQNTNPDKRQSAHGRIRSVVMFHLHEPGKICLRFVTAFGFARKRRSAQRPVMCRCSTQMTSPMRWSCTSRMRRAGRWRSTGPHPSRCRH